jgi:hypothetical protein
MTFFWVRPTCRLVGRSQRFREACCLHLLVWNDKLGLRGTKEGCRTNQPTERLTKGGDMRRCETSFLVRFNHSCVLNALLEMVNDALNWNWGFAYSNGFALQQKALPFGLGALLIVGDYPIRAYPSSKDFGWMVFLGVEPRRVGFALAGDLCDLGAITSAEELRDWGSVPCPFSIMPWHLPYNWGKARKTSVRAAE